LECESFNRNGNKEQQTLDDDVEEDNHAWWAGHKPNFMLELRFKNGNKAVYSYGDFRGARFGKELILYFDTATITIVGKGLGELLSGLRRHVVTYIQQQHVDALFERNRVTGGFVDAIEIKEPDLEALGKS
jgi:hypothetical protein